MYKNWSKYIIVPIIQGPKLSFALKEFLVNKYKSLKTKGKGYDMIHKLATFQTKTREVRYYMYFLTNICFTLHVVQSISKSVYVLFGLYLPCKVKYLNNLQIFKLFTSYLHCN